MVKFFRIRKGQVLPYKLLVYILICSSFFTILGTSIQLYMEYRNDVGEIQKGMNQIEQSYANTIAASLWDINIDHVKIQLEGALKLPGLRYLEVVEMSFGSVDPVASLGAIPKGKNIIERTYPLIHIVDGKTVEVGQLRAVAGLDDVFKKLKLRVFIIMLTQGVKTFLVALFILIIIHYMITRHLQAMADYAQDMDINNLDRELVLKRRRVNRTPDEIDMVVQAFNKMRMNLVRDIAERKKVEEALKEANMIVEKSPVILFKWRNEEGWPVELVSQNISQLGFQADEFLSGKIKYIEVIHHEDLDRVGQELMHWINHGVDHFIQQYRIVDHSGRVYWIEDSTVVVRDADGNVASFLGIAMDVTERVMAESELARLRNLLKNTIDSMPTVLVGVDENICINQWNKSAEEETHKTFEDVKGLHLFDLFPQLKSELDLIVESVKNLEVKEKNKIPFSADGEVQYKNIKIYPLLESEAGRGAVVLIDDVTMKSRLEDMMIQTEKMMSVGGLAAGMAHEINNPLGAVLSGVQGTERRFSPSLQKNIEVADGIGLDLQKVHQYMDQRGILGYLRGISDAGRRAARIVRNMLEFSRKSESTRAEVNVKGILEKTLSLAENDYDLKKKYDFKTIEVRRDYEQGLPKVSITETEIEQVFLNLFKNAAQAMIDKDFEGETPNITLRTRKDGDFVRIEVEDNGSGMDEDIRKRVFEPFYTTKRVGLGTGLGLSVSYFIITRNHEGEFLVESEPGKGSKFIIRLPVVENKID
ncbi:ATP-binding protein [Maridesulfovibrio zosterae]|uniref:ATP-binding protein n=1 Tax=Maridesulfovibrio zosterae TaxID=82171 RepID=UPI00041B1913|nr:ATP-binding protein [Maridesulfovibrio zosterae]